MLPGFGGTCDSPRRNTSLTSFGRTVPESKSFVPIFRRVSTEVCRYSIFSSNFLVKHNER